jgi:hypothetical protein
MSISAQETSGTEPVWYSAGWTGPGTEENMCEWYTVRADWVAQLVYIMTIPVAEMVKRDLPGYAIGGLSGGEEKDIFWKIVSTCTDLLPRGKPRYCMGVG